MANENSLKGIIDNYDCINLFLQNKACFISANSNYCQWLNIAVAAGTLSGESSSFGIKTDGTLWTWGRDSSGTLGSGTFRIHKCSPGSVFNEGTNWCQVSAGYGFANGIKNDGTLWAWGGNYCGQLGNNDKGSISVPIKVSADTTWCQISSGNEHVAAVKTDGTIWTWGRNFLGKLGDGTTLNRSSPGTVAGGGTTWCRVSLGGCHSLALKTDGTLWTWGKNGLGQIGSGLTAVTCSPGTVAGGGTTWCQISGGYYHSSAIKTDGTLWTWGSNYCGQLGDGTTVARCSPGTIAGGGTTWCQVSSGSYHNVAIKIDGTLWTWGYNRCGQVGNGTTINRCSPGTVSGGGTTWCRISSYSSDHNFVSKTDGTVWTWGNNFYGQLGDGTVQCRCSPISVPFTFVGATSCDFLLLSSSIDNISEHRQISVGSSNLLPNIPQNEIPDGQIVYIDDLDVPVVSNNECWIGLDGRVLRSDVLSKSICTWGSNFSGILGDGSTTSRCSPGTVAGGGTTWCQISSANYNAAGIKNDGTLWTWGRNGNVGYLGNGTKFPELASRNSPGTVAGGNNTWCSVSVGDYHSAAIKTDGTLWTWGANLPGKLGTGNYGSAYHRCSPGTIAGEGTTWCQVVAGFNHTAAIKTNGTLWTWGNNRNGSLGLGDTLDRYCVTEVVNIENNWCKVSSGYYRHMALRCDGTLWTWGCNGYGALGDGTTQNKCSPGTVAGGGTTWCEIATDSLYNKNMAIKTDGTLWTWGSNICGQLGDGTTINRCSPGTVAGGGTNWCKVSGSRYHAVAIKTDGTIWTWGRNNLGRLGDGTTINRCSPGTVAGAGKNWFNISSSFGSTIALNVQ